MIIRIVKMTFEPGKEQEFLDVFNRSKEFIRAFEGCTNLELYRDIEQPNIMFTYSFWNSTEDLQHYRESDFFARTWKETKALFSGKAEAWSVERTGL